MWTLTPVGKFIAFALCITAAFILLNRYRLSSLSPGQLELHPIDCMMFVALALVALTYVVRSRARGGN